MTIIRAIFSVQSWQEQAVHGGDDPPRVTRVATDRRYTGELEGHGVASYHIAYPLERPPYFTGFEHFSGSCGGRVGTLLIQLSGEFGADGVVTEHAQIVPSSGTGGLAGATGEGGWRSAHAESYPLTLNIEF